MGDASRFRSLSLGAGAGCLLLAFVAGGSVTSRHGCENTTLCPAGSPEGEIYSMHGAPDRVVELSNPVGPNVKRWTRYLAEWRIVERKGVLFTRGERRASLCYLIENGKVVNGSYVSSGEASAVFGEEPAEALPGTRTQVGRD